MGGRGRSRTQRKHFKNSRENVWKRSKSVHPPPPSDGDHNGDDNSNPGWHPFATENAAFEEYYKEQGIVPSDEWDTFMEHLRKPLPAAFRINSSSQFCGDIRLQLDNEFVKSLQVEFTGGDEVEPIRPLPWYPDNLAWHSNFSRNQLRKNQTLERFHEFLKQANEIGNITRQEAVSMVPPLFLDVHPDHYILDMCAAPGSKTFQLLEIIHQYNGVESLPNGLVVANDVDVQRSNLLIHQTKRMCTSNLIVTNHEAQNFPGCNMNKHRFHAADGSLKVTNINQLLFDRVLCDVPCSGDGTLRKAPDMWRKWNAGMGNGLHTLQIQIAMRGIALLKVGGRMVYSTCSMNPVENEAVVAEILRRCGDSVELLDVSNELPQLTRRPGLIKWKVRDKGIWLDSYEDVPEHRKSGVVPSMFPSRRGSHCSLDNDHGDGLGGSSENGSNNDSACVSQLPTVPSQVMKEEVSGFPLQWCIRLVPHDQNSGAFFIAVFYKRSPFPVTLEKIDNHEDLRHANGKPAEAISTEVVTSEKTDLNHIDAVEEASKESTPLECSVEYVPDEAALVDHGCQMSEENGKKDEGEPVVEDPGSEKAGSKRKLQIQGRWKGVDPVILFKDEVIINRIKAFYGIKDSFHLHGHLVVRNSDNNHVKRIYYISGSVKDVLELNFQVGQQLKIAAVGLKMFERQTAREGNSSPCSFRISSEGLLLLLPHITKQILHASPSDFKHLLQYKSVKFVDFVDAEFGDKASQLTMGCCIVVLREAGQVSSDPIQVNPSTIAIGCWKGRTNIAVMVSAIDCRELFDRLMKRWGADMPSQGETTTEDSSSMQDTAVPKPVDGVEKVIQEIDDIEFEEASDAAALEGV
ncbi:hypothetical protein Dimus_017844 [Dionaea muscipula]